MGVQQQQQGDQGVGAQGAVWAVQLLAWGPNLPLGAQRVVWGQRWLAAQAVRLGMVPLYCSVWLEEIAVKKSAVQLRVASRPQVHQVGCQSHPVIMTR